MTPRKEKGKSEDGNAQGRSFCGFCTSHLEVWCPVCWGFEGCEHCGPETKKVPCPYCSGGDITLFR